MKHLYILNDDKSVSATDDLDVWVKNRNSNKYVARDSLGYYFVSTVFTGVNSNFRTNDATPLVFETMLFGPGKYHPTYRSATYEEALDTHALLVKAIKEKL